MVARKARKEGAAAKRSAPVNVDPARISVQPVPDPKPEPEITIVHKPGDGDALSGLVDSFKERFPEDWDNIRLTPLQHGLEHMADLIRSRG